MPLIFWAPIFLHPKAVISVKITHIRRRWGTPLNFFLAFSDELEKQLIFIKKTVEVCQ